MLFNSLIFAIFLPIVFAVYWAIPHRFRWPVLLVASYYFYMSYNPKYVVLILLTTGVSYLCALGLEKTDNVRKRKLILAASMVVCLGILFVFKYFNFVSFSLARALSRIAIPLKPITLKLMLPVGISFYTFQTMGYVIDVYRGDVKAEKNFGTYATFVSFFPQLVAGPIERTGNLMSQIKGKHEFDYNQAMYGVKQMIWGFFKKIVIADMLSDYVRMIYSDPRRFNGFALVLATIFFSIQIYCDFSGYSDIAIGTSKLFGINLMTNFKSPYFSTSIKEFWSRWHISLSTWFRDYVYIPLGGNRVSKLRHYFNLMVTFLISGLWHGASWTFIAWGFIHGALQVVENVFHIGKKKSNSRVANVIRTVIIMAIVTFAWIFFAANTISDAKYIILNQFVGIADFAGYIKTGFTTLSLNAFSIAKIIVFVGMLAVYDVFALKNDCIKWLEEKPAYVRHIVCFGLILIIILFGASAEKEFIYFQF